MNKLSVIIPAYNEQDRIVKTLLEVRDFLHKQPYAYEVLVVNDGSLDNTVNVVSQFTKKNSNLMLLDLKKNFGKGWAIKQGMMSARGDVLMFMDADNSTSITHLTKMLPYLNQGYDIVIGSIGVAGAKIDEQAQWYRRFLGLGSKYIIRAVAGLWSIKDTQRGFKIFTQKAANKIFSRQTIAGFGFDIEILAIAKTLGYKIKEVPVSWSNPAGSSISFASYFKVLLDLAKIRMKLWLNSYQ